MILRVSLPMIRSVARLSIFWLAVGASAHIGSPDVFYEGDAGPYHLFVVVRVPQAIPGVAEVEVRSASAVLDKVEIVAFRLGGTDAELAPAPQNIEPSKADPRSFTGSLWMMESGAMQIRVQVSGAKGKGALAVPVPAVALQKLQMSKPLAASLFGLLLLLAAGMLSIVMAGAQEATLPPGKIPSVLDRQRARRVMMGAACLLLGVLYLGNRWWNIEDAAALSRIYKAPPLSARLVDTRLVLDAKSAGHNYFDDIIPDHGHLMHLFLIREPALDLFLHLHPEKSSTGEFIAQLPAMPSGHYKVFDDVVHQSGLPVTMTAELDLPEISGTKLTGDDSVWSGASIGGSETTTVSNLPDGDRVVWEQSKTPLRSGIATLFRFRVEDRNGDPAQDLEPYMGMAGHAEFVRSDLTVFAHVHPAGSVSMAALDLAQAELLGESATAQMAMPVTIGRDIEFPYGFPKPGTYRIFVQIKRSSQIRTAVFDAHVN